MDIVDLAQAEARLSELDAERRALTRLIEAMKAYEGVVGKLVFKTGNVTAREKVGVGRAAPIMRATEQAVELLLDVRGQPMGTAELLAALRHDPNLGLDTPNGANVLSARLSNSKRYVGRRGSGWWFADRPWPGEELALAQEEGQKEPPE